MIEWLASGASKTNGLALTMQTGGGKVPLFKDGIEQGSGVTAKYIGFPLKAPRPDTEAFDGTWVRNFHFKIVECSLCAVF